MTQGHTARHPARGPRILLVAADRNTGSALERILCRCGYHVEVVRSGEAAIAWAAERSFQVIVTQSHLQGGICGVTLLQRLREAGIETPLVLLAEEETGKIRQALGDPAGFVCLCETSDPDQLKEAVARFLH